MTEDLQYSIVRYLSGQENRMQCREEISAIASMLVNAQIPFTYHDNDILICHLCMNVHLKWRGY